ncbi:hypothetical protein MRB53_006651 [Persea americana]|uniref:Uncharacterized protein n=1 Tax=Persea americana TaxID=3435 RepID=A0ACC2MH06_PERAE|nr:hypothetical protein MRB53_006651 [Persea americana]
MEIAKDLWDDIKERFSVGNGPRIQQLKSELANCRQVGLPIVTYYGKLKQIWEELANYDQNSTCQCGACKCNLNATFEKKSEEEKVHQSLMELDAEVFGMVRSNILSTEPLPNPTKHM